MPKLPKERAERIAKGHECSHCQEYNFRRITVRVASAAIRDELGAVWIATKLCGVCQHREEIGIAEDGEVVYAG